MTLLDQLPPSRPMPAVRRKAARRQLENVVGGSLRPWWRLSRTTTLAIGIGLVIAGSATAGVFIPSKGPIPVAVHGKLPWNLVPDYISVSGPNGKVVGYAPRSDLLLPTSYVGPAPNGFGSMPIPVYASNLITLVGHLYPGHGYVPLGSSPNSSACIPEYEINGSTRTPLPCPSVKVTLPNLVGVNTPTAAAKLSALGVVVNVVNDSTSSAPKGTVISMSPGPGSVVHARSEVTIVNSSKKQVSN
jgi:hypothetical protein